MSQAGPFPGASGLREKVPSPMWAFLESGALEVGSLLCRGQYLRYLLKIRMSQDF